ncbi:MAG: DUF1080 domain-containing protein [Terriglobia bacterium]
MRSAFRNISMVAGVAVFLLGIFQAGISKSSQSEGQTRWQTHDMSRPQPRVVIPGEESTQDRPGRPPSDAIVLFDGKSLSNWQGADGGPAKWKVGNGYFEVVPKTGDIYTKQAFRDYQLHVEWLSPPWTPGNTYDPGNSGVYLASFYEVQIVDSVHSKIYADGQAAAMYGQYPPLVNVCRAPGLWQTYDIVFRDARFDKDKKPLRPAIVTVLHNGVLVQDHVELTGPTGHKQKPPFQPHLERMPLELQDHNYPVRFRNIWIRELGESQ